MADPLTLIADALAQHDYPNHPDDVDRHLRIAQAEAVLTALLPELERLLKPHRWDHEYPASAADSRCHHGIGPNSFYAGVLHAVHVIRNLIPSPAENEPPAI